MNHPEQDELQVLRERAYGPAADIHLDPPALQRLHELEGRGGAPGGGAGGRGRREAADELPPPAAEPALPAADEADVPPTRRRFAAFRMRRSTFLIVLGLVALIVVSYAALELVQRVQADPLQAGASQVARLSEDGTYEIPAFFSNAVGEPGGAHAYEDFHGLRAVINDNGMETDDKCILVYSSESIDRLRRHLHRAGIRRLLCGGVPCRGRLQGGLQGLPEHAAERLPGRNCTAVRLRRERKRDRRLR